MPELVYTVKGLCRVCYTCVRECPAKAIKIMNGQAEIIQERCIACGNCVKVCSQEAKKFIRFETEVIDLLQNSDKRLIACIAPSFPAEFSDIGDYKVLVGMMRKAGFYKVTEVGFGADLVAKEYEKILETSQKTIISSDCPAIVNYVTKYHPELTENLAPVISPMVAMNRVVKNKYGNDKIVVFIGPCVAKKGESDEVDIVMTFSELRNIFQYLGINNKDVEPAEFDEPLAGIGAIFPISRGLLQTMNKNEELGKNDIIAADGHKNFTQALKELSEGQLNTHYLELLCCEGCILGAGMTKKDKRFSKRTKVREYVNKKIQKIDKNKLKKTIDYYQKIIDFDRKFYEDDKRFSDVDEVNIKEILKKLGKTTAKDMLDCGACGYNTCWEFASAVYSGLAEDEMCLPFTIEKLHQTIDNLNITNEKLRTAQQALKQSEKLASMGQLSAGIAHELNNPLGIITMYSNLLKEETEPGTQLYKDIEMIAEQAERCKNIVGGLLNFARKNQVKLMKTNIQKLIEHSLQTIIIPENIEVKTKYNLNDKYFYVDYDQMIQVLNNLEKNAVEAMPDGGILSVTAYENELYFVIEVKDTGVGIPKENLEKIFTPFFTTKPLGKGTGLGLPLVYGIVKMHQGKIEVISANDDSNDLEKGTLFRLFIPKKMIKN